MPFPTGTVRTVFRTNSGIPALAAVRWSAPSSPSV